MLTQSALVKTQGSEPSSKRIKLIYVFFKLHTDTCKAIVTFMTNKFD